MNGHVSELMVNHQTENETESGDTETPHEQGGTADAAQKGCLTEVRKDQIDFAAGVGGPSTLRNLKHDNESPALQVPRIEPIPKGITQEIKRQNRQH